MSDISIQEKIDQISRSKQVYLSEDAIHAKRDYDSTNRPGENEAVLRSMSVFNDNVSILGTLFERSKFDEIVILLSRPHQLFLVNLMIGFFRGVGLVFGVVFVLIVVMVASGMSLANLLDVFSQAQ